MNRLRFAALAAIVVILTGALFTVRAAVDDPTYTLDEIFDLLGFEDADKEKIRRGEIVSRGLDDDLAETQLAVVLAVHLPIPPDELIEYLRDARDHHEDPDLLGFGEIDEAAVEESLAALKLAPDEGDEIRKLLAAEPGSEFNFSAAELERFAGLRERFSPKDCPDDPVCFEAVMSAYRDVFRGRFESYREHGVAGIAPYAREGGEQSNPTDELDAIGASTILERRRPDLHEAIYDYPRGDREIVDHAFQWFKIESQDRPNFLLSHRMEVLQPPVAFELIRQFYVGHSFNCSMAATGLFPVEGKTFFFFFVNRTFTEQVTGFMAGTRRKMGGKIMSKHLREDLERLRENLESP